MNTTEVAVLVLYANYTSQMSYFDDWLDAFSSHPRVRCRVVDICRRDSQASLRAGLRGAELIVLLHSTNGDGVDRLDPLCDILRERQSPLVSFVGNEVNIPGISIADKRRVLGLIEPEFIASQLPIDAARFLWSDVATRQVLSVPHALNPHAFRAIHPYSERPIGVGSRTARYSAALGDLDRNRVNDLFLSLDSVNGLPIDISTERLNRDQWSAFLNSCRATVSTESGSWYLEKDDRTVTAIAQWALSRSGRVRTIKNSGRLARMKRSLPTSFQQFVASVGRRAGMTLDTALSDSLDPDELLDTFFRGPRPDFYGKCVSSRHFEAAGTGTVQVLLEGRYNNCFDPSVHYIELDSEFSNLGEVLEQLADAALCSEIAQQAREHCLDHHTYRHRVDQILSSIDTFSPP